MSEPTGPAPAECRADCTVRYWAAARAAAGCAEEQYPCPPYLGDLLAAIRARHDSPQLAAVLAVCSYLIDGAPVGSRDPAWLALPPGAVVEALPPFAGG